MLQIEKISLYPMQNNEHFQFMTDVKDLVVAHNAEMLGIDNVFPAFLEAFQNEDLHMKVETGSLKTLSVKDTDHARDEIYSAVRGRTQSTLLSPFETERESARALMRCFDLYGNVRQMSYNAESAALTNLVYDLKSEQNAGYLLSVGIGPWVDELEKENNNFIALMNARNKEYSGRESGDVRTARLAIDPLYTNLVDRLNAMILLNIASDEVEPFVKELNEKIKYYEKVVKTRESKNKNKEKEVSDIQTDQ
ncbi:hypothetical protein C8N47_11549 [Mangrovibacterium marinum]|uniref:Uncharacterized protein n=1 Tax=Mangrovibacterium marinum TaxID=1639118 RepID=A0A2T5BZB1_9BACT|nr:DUF6261 family protein [Mangrovibacterium marinum]PTN07610.1 hypothetical protein C8N47_11549 [Mangrovibacterium marinum]